MSTLKANEPFSTRYHLIRRIGLGGYSEVWLANDTLAGNMQVALKIFAPDKGLDEQGTALFSKEYSLVFNLNHPKLLLPKYFDVADGSPFLVLPYCEAGSVFSKIGMMSEPDLARFLQQAASALAYLHSQEPPIIHQDIKPDNFLIDNQGNYLLSDFGISSKIRRTLTRSMGAPASAGTMAYMPPEKWSRERQVVKASDVFSLGVTLFELITGDLPFGDHGGLALNSGAEAPDLPAEFAAELNTLLRSCLAKEPWERPTTLALQQMAQNYMTSGNWQVGSMPIGEQTKPEPSENKVHRSTQPISLKVETPLDKAIAAGEFESYFRITKNFKYNNLIEELFESLKKKWGEFSWNEFEFVFNLQRDIYEREKSKGLFFQDFDLELIWVNGGEFIMGSIDGEKDAKPTHVITLDGFYLGRVPVTQKQWRLVAPDMPIYFKNDNYPVERISWLEAQKFLLKLSQFTDKTFALPTEAQWEFAAGGGINGRTLYSGTSLKEKLPDYAWFIENSGSQYFKSESSRPVGKKLPNKLGLNDMSGNVNEWCNDWYDPNYYSISPEKNPKGPLSGQRRVFRGGDWRSGYNHCSVFYRGFSHPNDRSYNLGFRVALTL